MKRIFAIIFAAVVFLAVACYAQEAPNPDKWYHVGANEEIELWIDLDSVRFSRQAYGKTAFVLVMFHKLDGDEIKLLNNYELNMDRKEVRLLSYIAYDKEKNFLNSVNKGTTDFKKITPDSIGEDIYNALLEIEKRQNRPAASGQQDDGGQ